MLSVGGSIHPIFVISHGIAGQYSICFNIDGEML
jgi:hypothetical protein